MVEHPAPSRERAGAAAAVGTEGRREPQEHQGLSATFHEKAIKLRTMQLRLLLPSAVAIALVVAAAILLAGRDLPWPQVGAGPNLQTGQLQTVPLPVAVFGALALALAWSFILSGALHAHLVFRIGGVVAYLINGSTVLIAALGTVPTLLMVPLVLGSVVVAALGLYLTDRGNHHQAPHLHHRARLRVPTFAWVLLATALLYAMGILGGLRQGDMARFVTLQLLLLEAVIVPVLFLAGTDFAEWSEVVSGRVGSPLLRLPPWCIAVAIAAAALGVLVWGGLVQGGLHLPQIGRLALQVVPVLILLLAVGLVGWLSLSRPTSTRVPFWALVVGVLIVFLAPGLGTLVLGGGRSQVAAPAGLPSLVVYQQDDPLYSLSVPQGWSHSEVPGGAAWTGPDQDGGPSRLVLVSTAGSGSPDAGVVERRGTLALGVPLRAGTPSQAGAWNRWEVTARGGGAAQQGIAFTRHDGAREWILIGLSPAGVDRAALWAAVRDTWTPGEPAAVALPEPTLASAVPWIALGIALLLAFGLVLLRTGRGEVATAGVFLLNCALFQAAGQNLAGNTMTLLGVHDPPYVYPQYLAVGLGAAALLLVAALWAVPRWRPASPVLRLLLVLLLGVIGLDLLYEGVFQTALVRGEQFTVLQGVVLVAAMLWDVLMSGESFTNNGGPRVPRHSRVLIYLGYTIVVVTTVVVLGSLGFQGGGEAGGFESDSWVQAGIVGFGGPLLFTFFFVNLSAWRRSLPKEPGEIDQVDRSILDETAAPGTMAP